MSVMQTPILNGHTIILAPPASSYGSMQGAPRTVFIQPDSPFSSLTINQVMNAPKLRVQPFTQFVNGVPVLDHTCQGNDRSECSCGGNCRSPQSGHTPLPSTSLVAQASSNQLSVSNKNIQDLKNLITHPNPYRTVPPCPDVPDFFGIPWQKSGCYWATVDNCNVFICWCARVITHRDLFGALVTFVEYATTRVEILQPCSVDPSQILQDLGQQLISDDPASLGGPPSCDDPVIGSELFYRYSKLQCWSWHFETIFVGIQPIQIAVLEDCSGYQSWCVQLFRVCIDPVTNNKVMQLVGGTTTTGYDCGIRSPGAAWPENSCMADSCF